MTEQGTERQVYTVREVAHALGIREAAVYKMLECGKLTCVQQGRRKYIPASLVRVLTADGTPEPQEVGGRSLDSRENPAPRAHEERTVRPLRGSKVLRLAGGDVLLDAEDHAWARMRRWCVRSTREGEDEIISVAKGPILRLAHLIAEIATGEPGRGRAVAYLDGDPWNLTRDNTRWQNPMAWRQAA